MPYKLPEIFDKQLGRNQPAPPKPVAVKPEPVPGQPPGKAPDPNDPQKTQAYELYLFGWGPTDIERECGIKAKTITNWAYKDRWNERKDYYDALKSKKFPPHEQPIVKAVITANRDERRREFLEHTGKFAVEDAKHWSKMTPAERLENAQQIAALNKVDRDNIGANDEESANARGHISLTFLSEADKPGMVRIIETPAQVQRIEDKE